ncbi:GspH/FimT family pseudopilin [Actimicrobium sp. CCC2.4]|uniref:GspH/FimT family pseudopilin n=1 Tax=Actimicrobium sp. CCC2.4 TaxID=3048606 RepID=UPI002AC957C5|nr:GspH/FimT family pseudopilin [Actimicrobium sp. CCC2.4]MEB0135122.1 GspH/FimT family pseudopilin [Actimicrobium sp. CCC2.4]WPX31833.1 GspH/FimT family pseudopilin [Actimicrobium sp. CCC2.4]
MKRSLPRVRQPAAFTLIELMITIAIAAILLSIAIPSFSTMLGNNRLTARANALLTALNFTRSSALTQNISARLCPLGVAGSATCGTDWGAGWIVTTLPATGAGVLLQSQQAGPRDPLLSPVAINGVTPVSIVFDTRGLAATQSNFILCDARGSAFARSLQVLATGYAQLGPAPGTALWGGVLTCP